MTTVPTAIASEQDFADFVARHVERTRPLHRQSAEAWWKANTTGQKQFEEESARLEAELRKLYANPDEYRLVKDAHESGKLRDPHLLRQARLLSHAYLANQMPPDEIERLVALEKEVESEFNNHRAQVGAEKLTDNQIKDVLRHGTDNVRRQAAWEGSKQVGEKVAERVLKLVQMRNESARKLGFRDFYQMHLELQDLDEKRLFELLEELARLTDPVWTAFKTELDESLGERLGVAPWSLAPWHYSDPFFQELPHTGGFHLDPWFKGKNLEEITVRFYDAIGLDIMDIVGRSDLYEREGKCQHAFCICIDREQDVRVLCNLQSDESWMSTMLHEFGHAVYDKYIDARLPFLLREPAHTLFTEAVAMFMGRLSRDGDWLYRYVHVPESEARAAEAALRRQIVQQLLVFVRWGLVVVHFERAMYADPERDLNALWWELVERYQGVKRPEGRRKPDWAAKIHLAVAPVYYQNYLLGEMVASQFLHHLKEQVLQGAPLVADERTGEWFRTQIFHAGTSAHWEETLARATGEPLNPRYLVDALVASQPVG